MPYHFLEVAVTPSVRAVQADMGADQIWLGSHDRPSDTLTDAEIAFITTRDSFYMASVSETGWPYVQHRGGKAGFLKVVDQQTMAFADYRGNRQYISAGNFAANDRTCLFLMDYVRRARLKIYAYVEQVELDADQQLAKFVSDSDYRGRAERIFKLRLEAFDWNCPQHITPRYTEHEVGQAIAPLRDRLQQLEAENAALRARLEDL
ncbi:pyridoxamine 5'-phosphate oxidase family protein [Agrobacterium sp. Azo12]|uniref:pyridoxamine 5'-phosphate oxidase family protein n=1 Tax=Agrobacterium sp. Azo12 TaxID=3031129 RepID=UPI0023D8ACB0|nr:pyridoxamine 5'-phosphate oxidase family protein [Agrobacterium sp. Azo12]MDO5897852.1 pyridoxamine 5'-phosphate oxidase family protein [Agrobacterium sp. Azo12]